MLSRPTDSRSHQVSHWKLSKGSDQSHQRKPAGLKQPNQSTRNDQTNQSTKQTNQTTNKPSNKPNRIINKLAAIIRAKMGESSGKFSGLPLPQVIWLQQAVIYSLTRAAVWGRYAALKSEEFFAKYLLIAREEINHCSSHTLILNLHHPFLVAACLAKQPQQPGWATEKFERTSWTGGLNESSLLASTRSPLETAGFSSFFLLPNLSGFTRDFWPKSLLAYSAGFATQAQTTPIGDGWGWLGTIFLDKRLRTDLLLHKFIGQSNPINRPNRLKWWTIGSNKQALVIYPKGTSTIFTSRCCTLEGIPSPLPSTP